ncbi:hypothetical protein HK097_011001, partial [Rhizophlyctis rosea]
MIESDFYSTSSSSYSPSTSVYSDSTFDGAGSDSDSDIQHQHHPNRRNHRDFILPSSKSYATFERPFSSVPFLNTDIKYPDETAPLVYYQRKKSVVVENDGSLDVEKGGSYEPVPVADVVFAQSGEGGSIVMGGGVGSSVSVGIAGSHVLPEPTIFSSTVNMINTILGTCMMSMPYAFARVGLLPGITLVLISAIATWFSLRILIASAQSPHHLAARNPSHPLTFFTPFSAPSYAALSRGSMGGSSGWWVDMLVAMSCLGFAVGYLVAIGECMPRLVTSVVPGLVGVEGIVAGLLLNKHFWMFGALLILVPLSLSRDVDDFRWFSGTALACAVYLAAVVVGLFVSGSTGGVGGTPSSDPDAGWQWIIYDGKIPEIVPIFVFAFTCQQNIFSVYNELVAATARSKATGKPTVAGAATVHDIYKIIDLAVGACAFTYISVGVAGYITFGAGVDSILLNNYGNSMPVFIGRLAYVLLAALSYPIYIHPCRDAVDSFLSSCCPSWYGPSSTYNNPSTPLLPPTKTGLSPRTKIIAILHSYTETEHVARSSLTMGLVVLTYAVALGVRGLDTALTFVGATGGVV